MSSLTTPAAPASIAAVTASAIRPEASPPLAVVKINTTSVRWCQPVTISNVSPRLNCVIGYPGTPAAPDQCFAAAVVPVGTKLQLTLDAHGAMAWTGCTTSTARECGVTVPSGGVVVSAKWTASPCWQSSTPAFTSITKRQSSGTWVISYAARYLTPYDGPFTAPPLSNIGWTVNVTASCSGFSTTAAAYTTKAGTSTGTITVPTARCSGGALKLVDSNIGVAANGTW
jgi:hypothetical protein